MAFAIITRMHKQYVPVLFLLSSSARAWERGYSVYAFLSECCKFGQVENAEVRKQKYGNRSTETEVRKPKYGSGKKSPLPVSSALLTYVRLCLVDKG